VKEVRISSFFLSNSECVERISVEHRESASYVTRLETDIFFSASMNT
jgi:hypothetical protein